VRLPLGRGHGAHGRCGEAPVVMTAASRCPAMRRTCSARASREGSRTR
jgi:hypothetical protein